MSHASTDVSFGNHVTESPTMPRGLDLSVADVSAEPLKIEEVQDWLRIGGGGQFTVIEMLITAIRKEAERLTGRLMTQREVTATWDHWYTKGDLPKPPIASISSVEDYDTDTDSFSTVSSSDYDLVGRTLTLDDGNGGDILRVTYDAGYSSLPKDLKLQMLKDIRFAYDHRDPGDGDSARVQDESVYRQYRPY